MLRLSEAIKKLAKRVQKSDIDDNFRELAIEAFNLGYFEVGKAWDWIELETYGSIIARKIVEGTVSIMNGSRTVTIGGAQSVWKGRFFKQRGGQNLYRIVDVNTTTNVLTLDQDIIEGTGSISYEIEQFYYPIPSEVRKIIAFENLRDVLLNYDGGGLRQTIQDYDQPLKAVPFEITGTDKFIEDYTTGTISAITGSNIINGTNTEWLDNVQAGAILRFGNKDYTVRRVELDIRIVLYNSSTENYSGTYSIIVDNPLTIRMRVTFNEDRVIPFHYIRHVHDLVHDNDRTELNKNANLAILDFGEAYLLEILGKTNWAEKLLKAQSRLETIKNNYKPFRPAYQQFAPLIPKGNGRG